MAITVNDTLWLNGEALKITCLDPGSRALAYRHGPVSVSQPMNEVARLTIHEDPPEEVVRPIAEGLRQFNESQVGSVTPTVLVISASNDDRDTIGGIKGLLLWGWLYVEKLWVKEEKRGCGLGGTLLERLESEAAARGARRSVLLSGSWQAPEFYKNRGYTAVASFELEIPSGRSSGDQTDYLFVKSL